MANIVEHVSAPVDPATAFAYLADFTNTRHWDPQIDGARRLDDGPIGPGSAFEVDLRLGKRTVPIIYTVTTFAPHARVVLDATGRWFHGRDDVRVRALPDGTSEVTWDATFALRGPLRILDPLMAVGFRRVATAAVAGLAVALSELDRAPDAPDAPGEEG
jgi:hypothetical protein